MDTTPPNPGDPKQVHGWQMPQPVFRQSSGYLPEGYLDQIAEFEAAAEAVTDQPNSDSPAAASAAAPVPTSEWSEPDDVPAPPPDDDERLVVDEDFTPIPIDDSADVEPQPDVSEEIAVDNLAAAGAVPAPDRSGAARVIAFLLFALVFLVIALAIIGVAYYLFLADSPVNGNF